MKAKRQVLTANRLKDGEVVYLTVAGVWAEGMDAIRVADTKAEADALFEIGVKAEENQIVVGPYLFDVAIENNIAIPLGAREIIRTKGPTVRLDLGKQALSPKEGAR
jgi:hypothetical protein